MERDLEFNKQDAIRRDLEDYEELDLQQINKIARDYDERQAYERAKEQSDIYRKKNRNIFEDGYQATHGGSAYMKLPFLRRKEKGKKKSDINYINSVEKAKSRKGLLDDSEEGIFDNISDKKQLEYVQNLADRCREYYNIPYATPDFMATIALVDKYVTASTYEDQQAAVAELMKAFDDYLFRHGNVAERDAIEDDLYDKILRLNESFRVRTNGSLTIPQNVQERDLIYADDPDTGGGVVVKYAELKEHVLFPHEPSPNDVKQRITSDCYLMSALASIAYCSPELIRSAMKDNGDTVTVRFYDPNNGYASKYVTVKKSIPEVRLASIQINSIDCLWVQMIEKAFAAFYGNLAVQDNNRGVAVDNSKRSYTELSYKDSFQFLSRFLGSSYAGVPQSLLPTDSKYEKMKKYEAVEYREISMVNPIDSGIYSPVASRLYDSFSRRLSSAEVITVGVLNEENTAKGKAIAARGIHLNHAYAVLKVYEKEKNGRMHMYVRLRDPYGAYTSGYNDNDEAISTGNSTLMFDATDTMGTFDLEWNDFIGTFNSYSGCKSINIPDLSSPKYQMVEAKEQLEPGFESVARKARIRSWVMANNPELGEEGREEELKRKIDIILEEEASGKVAAEIDEFLGDD